MLAVVSGFLVWNLQHSSRRPAQLWAAHISTNHALRQPRGSLNAWNIPATLLSAALVPPGFCGYLQFRGGGEEKKPGSLSAAWDEQRCEQSEAVSSQNVQVDRIHLGHVRRGLIGLEEKFLKLRMSLKK